MKARLPKGYGNGGVNNIQQLARQAQKLQDDMEAALYRPDRPQAARPPASTPAIRG